MNEFDIIREVFAPLTASAPGAFNLSDDAALIESQNFVVTKDLMVAGVHFLPKDPLDLVARKLIRVNLSDLAAKGAKPVGYFLGCVWPQNVKREDIELFARGLAEDQQKYRISLYGGDTTAHRAKAGPLTLSATFFGTPPKQGVVSRSGASLGDDLYVSGTIGDAGLGLAAIRKEFKFTTVDKASLTGRYRLPEPRLVLGGALAGLATAAIDVSDGLIADAGHLARASGLRAEIDAVAAPRSPGAAAWVAAQDNRWKALAKLASFGDDYEILFAAPPALRRSVTVAAKASRTEVSRIGSLTRGEGVLFLDEAGAPIPVPEAGYDHFKKER
ncbi:thiamine-phosphate kinase [Hyphococcus luteus]|uniref:Thiamine-monophosphate kinase n=1 Tax=Hyphococcus luteus TaxID=2058213 RepID=A0A2S7K0Q5_9PROT|nr:thiamine-phosphate kinase [Marinicaulis flavus]PQA86103.1 thiamine-phosphate kinase [Marinicaulis flavus]